MRSLLSAALALGLVGCAGAATTDKGLANRAIIGAELIQAGQVARLGEALARASGASSDAAALDEATDRLLRDGRSLENGMPVKDPGATLQVALPRLQALASRAASAGPARAMQAGEAQGCVDAFLAAARFYNQDAPSAGVAKATLPGG